jgi:hypothetical protein
MCDKTQAEQLWNTRVPDPRIAELEAQSAAKTEDCEQHMREKGRLFVALAAEKDKSEERRQCMELAMLCPVHSHGTTAGVKCIGCGSLIWQEDHLKSCRWARLAKEDD